MVRADMDALPIVEEGDREFISTVPGVMHACGHDAHTSMLIGLATVLMQRRTRLPGQ
jgi:amidohydrolase